MMETTQLGQAVSRDAEPDHYVRPRLRVLRLHDEPAVGRRRIRAPQVNIARCRLLGSEPKAAHLRKGRAERQHRGQRQLAAEVDVSCVGARELVAHASELRQQLRPPHLGRGHATCVAVEVLTPVELYSRFPIPPLLRPTVNPETDARLFGVVGAQSSSLDDLEDVRPRQALLRSA